MATSLFVGQLSFNTDDEALRELFEKHGSVSNAQIIKDRDTGRSKGFGFVEMENEEEAKAAIAALDGSDADGRQLVVNVARPKEQNGPRGGSGGGPRRDNNSRGGGGDRGGFHKRY